VTIWWLKAPNKLVASISVAIQWLFVILFVGIGFGENTHPPNKYYATPTPVRPFHTNIWKVRANILSDDSTGAGLVKIITKNESPGNTFGSG
jgi:hypothetical protein